MSGNDAVAAIEAQHVSKSYPGTAALTDVSLSAYGGEVLALVGENGAGKSTLLKILAGVESPTAGSLLARGEHYRPSSPSDARERGVGIVFQETGLQPRFSVAENLLGGDYRQFRRFGIVNWRGVRAQASQHLRSLGIDVAPRARVEDLELGVQRLVELGAVLMRDPHVVLVDEITAALNAHEVRRVFEEIRALRERGVAVIYISHHLEEIFELCDRVIVMRDGCVVGERPVQETSHDILSSMMVGRTLVRRSVTETRADSSVHLQLEGLASEPSFRDVRLTIGRGEIVGFAGLQASGTEAVLEVLFGLRKASGGRVTLNGRSYRPQSPRDALARGTGYVPKERDSEGIIPSFSIRNNITLPVLSRLSRGGIRSPRRERSIAYREAARVGVRPLRLEMRCESLSGGNRQKVVLAKWLATEPEVLLLNNPTRGVDVGAKDEIYELIGQLSAKGVTIVIASEDLPELLGLCQRIVVMRRGEISRVFHAAERPTEDHLIEEML